METVAVFYDGTYLKSTNSGTFENISFSTLAQPQNDITKDPTGFSTPEDVIVNYNSVDRTITLTGTFVAYWRGVVVASLISGWESDPHDDITGPWFLYYDGSSFIWSQSPWTFDLLQIAYAYNDGINFGMRECHGLMQHETHKEFHETIGTYRSGGGDLGSYVLNSTTAGDRRPTVSMCTINDEDLQTEVNALISDIYTTANLTSTGIASFNISSADIVPLDVAKPYYNLYTGGAWTQEPMANNSYMCVWLAAFPVTEDVESQSFRYLWVQGQSNGSLESQEALTVNDLNKGDFAALSPEFIFITKIIIQYTAANWRIKSVENLTGTKFIQSNSTGSFLTSVTTDGVTITGNGTVGSPLVASIPNSLLLKGEITLAEHFPTPTEVATGWVYTIGANVTDNDITKTNTGLSFQYLDEVMWGGTTWTVLGNVKNVDYLGFDTSYTPTGSESIGDTYYDSANGTITTVLPNGVLGQHFKEAFIDGQNDTGTTITDGTPVEYSGSIGNSGNFRITPAIVTADKPAFYFVGIATHAIDSGDTGKITTRGKVRGIQTNGANYGETWSAGDIVYISATTAGYLTNVMPEAPYPAISVALVISAHATMGTLEVRPNFPQRLQDSPDVNGTALTADGQIPVWHNTEKYFDFDYNISDYLKTVTTDGVTISGNGTVGSPLVAVAPVYGDIIPSETHTYDLGSPTKVWDNIYLSDSSLYLGDTHLTEHRYKNAEYNIALNAFRIATQGSLTIFNMIDGFVDEYEDESGIDSTASINELYSSTDDYYIPVDTGGISGIILHYKMNDNAATTTIVDNISGFNATLNVNTNTNSVSGKINTALEFNGSGDYAVLPTISPAITGQFTLAFWAKPLSYLGGSNIGVVDYGAYSPSSGFGVWMNSSLYFGWRINNNYNHYKSQLNGTAGTWVHIAIVYNGSTVVTYKNGSQATTESYSTNPNAPSTRAGALAIREDLSSEPFHGSLDDIRIYNTALDSTQIGSIYNSGNGTEDDSSSGLVEDMTLISEPQTAEEEPTTARIIILEEDVDVVTINTDLLAHISKDGGTTFDEVTLSDEGDYNDTTRVLTGEVALTSTGTEMVYKLVTDNEKSMKIHGVSLTWN